MFNTDDSKLIFKSFNEIKYPLRSDSLTNVANKQVNDVHTREVVLLIINYFFNSRFTHNQNLIQKILSVRINIFAMGLFLTSRI